MAIDPLEAARQRALRTGRSYFPAANTTTSYGGGYSIPSPENNPAYQAAINRPRLGRSDLTTIRLPSGGTTTVPSGSAGQVAQAVLGSQVTQIGNQLPFNYAAAKAKGFGPPAPYTQGGYLFNAGVATPPELLTPRQRTQYGLTGTPIQRLTDPFTTNPALSATRNFFGGLGQNIANWFRPNPSSFGGTSAAGAVPTPSPTPPPIPTATPFKTASERGDLMNDINGTFYGGGQAPVPTPTPTPYQAPNMAYEPRRYFDYYA